MNISRLFTSETRQSLATANEDYVSKDTDEYALIKQIKRENNLEKVYRFDIGRNSDGYSDLIYEVMAQADLAGLAKDHLIDYPDNHYNLLRKYLAKQHGLDPSWFVLSSGLESIIDHISRIFIKDCLAFLSAVPNFSVLRTFSKIHALPSLRVGYLMCSNQDVIEAVTFYRPMFPFSWFSLFVAQIASIDDEHVKLSRATNIKRRNRLYEQLSELETFIYIPSETNTLMLKNSSSKRLI